MRGKVILTHLFVVGVYVGVYEEVFSLFRVYSLVREYEYGVRTIKLYVSFMRQDLSAWPNRRCVCVQGTFVWINAGVHIVCRIAFPQLLSGLVWNRKESFKVHPGSSRGNCDIRLGVTF